MQTASTLIDLQHTWFQEPIRFEDAFGRVIPIPSEYEWSVSTADHGTPNQALICLQKIEFIIRDQFSSSPGYEKVFASEYELFNTADNSQIMSESDFPARRPGLAITMAMIIGRHEQVPLSSCPRPGCVSTKFEPRGAGDKIWSIKYSVHLYWT